MRRKNATRVKPNPVSSFYRYSEGVKLGRYSAAHPDDLMIGNYGNGFNYEFVIREDETIDAIRVEVFDDAFVAFNRNADLFRYLSDIRPKTLNQIQAWLEANGYKNQLAGTEAVSRG